MKIRIVTLNVLALPLCTPKRFFYVPPTWQRISQLCGWVETQMDRRSVICLQEVDNSLKGKFATIARARNYAFVIGQSPIAVMIMCPRAYNPVNVLHCQVGAHVRLPADPTSAHVRSYPHAMASKNEILAVRITPRKGGTSTGTPVDVYCYHMPCKYMWPAFINMHTEAIKRLVERVSGTLPHAVCGDFNSKPSDDFYSNMLCSGMVDTQPVGKISTRCKGPGGDVFEATLDYVFVSDGLCHSEDTHAHEDIAPDQLLPSDAWPSDHVPVSTVVDI